LLLPAKHLRILILGIYVTVTLALGQRVKLGRLSFALGVESWFVYQ
jgi:hypothetical protein